MSRSLPIRTAVPGISDLVDRQRYKEALDLIKKKLKKSSDSGLLALRAQILFEAGDAAGSAAQCRELLASKTPVTDPDVLNALFATLAELLRAPSTGVKLTDLTKLWQDAIAQQASTAEKAEYAMEWASSAVALGLWSQMAQAAGAVQRYLAPTDRSRRQFFFWQQVGNWLDSSQPGTDSRMGIMVLRSLEMAVKNIPDVEPTSDAVIGNWISSKSEYALLRQVFLSADNSSKLLQMIQGKKLGPKDEEAVLDSWGVHQSKLDALWTMTGTDSGATSGLQTHALQCWDEAYQILKLAHSASVTWKLEKFDYWAILIGTLVCLDFPQEQTEKTIEMLNSQNLNRTSSLAKLLFWKCRIKKAVNPDPQSVAQLLDAFSMHITLTASNPLGIEDSLLVLDNILNLEEPAIRTHLLNRVESLKPGTQASDRVYEKWLSAEVNVLKLEFARLQASSSETGIPGQDLESFVCQALGIYKLSRHSLRNLPKTARHPGDEAALVAARALLVLGLQQSSQKPLLQAIVILQHVTQGAEHNSDARSVLLSPLQHLGMFSLATAHYKKLRVRSVLHENSAPRLFTRASTFTPFADRSHDTVKIMREALVWYAQSINQTPHFEERALDHKNYQQAIQIEAFRTRLRDSATRQLLRLECRRASRIAGVPFLEAGIGFEGKTAPAGPLHTAGLKPDPGDKVSRGPAPSLEWITAMRVIDAGLSLATDVAKAAPESAAYKSEAAIILGARDTVEAHALTAAEHASYGFALTLGQAAVQLAGVPSELATQQGATTADIATLLEQAETLRKANHERVLAALAALRTQRTSAPFPGWTLTHEIYTFLDGERALSKLVEHAGKSKAVPASAKERAAALRQAVTEAREKIRGEAIAVGSWLEDWWAQQVGSSLSFVLDGDVGTLLREIAADGEVFDLQRCVGMMLSSAKEAVDGILRVKAA